MHELGLEKYAFRRMKNFGAGKDIFGTISRSHEISVT